MNEKVFLSEYFNKCAKHLEDVEIINEAINAKKIILESSANSKKLIFAGNGASASIANHASLDFTKQGKIKSVNFNESAFITAFANDFGYENWLSKCIEIHGNKNDLLILISCSGNSKNLIKAQQKAKKKKINVISLTGCKKNNKLNSSKNICKIWINSNKYNVIEIIHHTILLSIIDRLMKKK